MYVRFRLKELVVRELFILRCIDILLSATGYGLVKIKRSLQTTLLEEVLDVVPFASFEVRSGVLEHLIRPPHIEHGGYEASAWPHHHGTPNVSAFLICRVASQTLSRSQYTCIATRKASQYLRRAIC